MNQQAVKPEAANAVPLASKIQLFDQAVQANEYEEAVKQLLDILLVLENGKEGFGNSTTATGVLVERQATILCAAATRLLSDKNFLLTLTLFIRLAHLKRPMMQAFEISGYRGTSHLLQSIGTLNEQGDRVLTKNEIAKLFFGLSINAMTSELLALLKRQSKEIAWLTVCGFLSEQIVWSGAAKAARAEILTWADHFIGMDTSYDMVRNIGPSYMGCSYDESAHKHDIKRAMNDLVRRWALSVGCTDIDTSTPRRAVKKRPTIVIFAELYDSKHAMHRCYGPCIRALKSKFKTIFMPISGRCDPELEYMFDKVDNTQFQVANPKEFIDKVKSYRPDIVYFPSVGMRFASIVASNIRMAPIQIFTPGHPATTHSNALDYWMLVDGYLGQKTPFSEKALVWPSQPYFEMRSDAKPPAPIIGPETDTVRVAVPAWSRKISPTMYATYLSIQQQAKKRVEFVFFPNGVGGLFQAADRRITTELNASVLPRTGYNDYINQLNSCDLYLSSFPFGSTNGLVDGLRQGLPVVNMIGDECHERIDADILTEDIQPTWLTAQNQKEYVAAAIRLIDNHAERVALRQHILSVDIDKKLLAAPEVEMTDFADLFWAAYQKHESMQTSAQKTWTYEEIEGL